MLSGGLSVKRLWLVISLVLLISFTGYAAQGISIGGGVIKGSLINTISNGSQLESSNLSYYVTASGAYQIGSVPLAFTGSYSSVAAETFTGRVASNPDTVSTLNYYNSSSLLKMFVGYTLPNT
jgi:hypothetical protein